MAPKRILDVPVWDVPANYGRSFSTRIKKTVNYGAVGEDVGIEIESSACATQPVKMTNVAKTSAAASTLKKKRKDPISASTEQNNPRPAKKARMTKDEVAPKTGMRTRQKLSKTASVKHEPIPQRTTKLPSKVRTRISKHNKSTGVDPEPAIPETPPRKSTRTYRNVQPDGSASPHGSVASSDTMVDEDRLPDELETVNNKTGDQPHTKLDHSAMPDPLASSERRQASFEEVVGSAQTNASPLPPPHADFSQVTASLSSGVPASERPYERTRARTQSRAEKELSGHPESSTPNSHSTAASFEAVTTSTNLGVLEGDLPHSSTSESEIVQPTPPHQLALTTNVYTSASSDDTQHPEETQELLSADQVNKLENGIATLPDQPQASNEVVASTSQPSLSAPAISTARRQSERLCSKPKSYYSSSSLRGETPEGEEPRTQADTAPSKKRKSSESVDVPLPVITAPETKLNTAMVVLRVEVTPEMIEEWEAAAAIKRAQRDKVAESKRRSRQRLSGKTTGATKSDSAPINQTTPKIPTVGAHAVVKSTITTPRARKVAKKSTAALPTPKISQTEEADHSLLSKVEPRLLDLARALTHRDPLGIKPKPSGRPQVWADSRQALCETVPYFKKPQGGCHSNDKHVYAFIFDGVGHCREYVDNDVIIARAGGGMESDSSGGMSQSRNQVMSDSQVQSVLNDIKLQNPLIIICGDKNTGAQCQMPHKYNVLGWYKPTMVWAEKTAGKGKRSWVTIKYRFERLAASDPWYIPQVIPSLDTAAAGALVQKTCAGCQQNFPQLYLAGWTCLNSVCERFWKLEGGQDVPCGKLLYNPAFLLDRTQWQNEKEPYSVVPAFPDIGKAVGDNLTYINTRGVVCPDCGRCNQRYLFKGWRCDGPDCQWSGLWPDHQPIMPTALHVPWGSSGHGPALARNKHEGGVNVTIRYSHNYKILTYSFPGIEGSFVHAIANDNVNREPLGPNDMLAELQTVDMGLERRRFGTSSAQSKLPVTPSRIVTTSAGLLTPSGDDQSESTDLPTTIEISASATDPLTMVTPVTPPTGHSPHAVERDSIQEGTIVSPSVAMPAGLLTPPQEMSQPIEQPAAVSEETVESSNKPADVEEGDFMTAFSMNYGMPYKFVATGASKSFDDEKAPWPVRECRSRLNWASKEFLPNAGVDDKLDLNEELIFAYMEGQKIEYHDDGEEGLGPTIATLSLGGKAKMHMRLKAKHHFGCSKTGVLTADRPVPGSVEYEKRLQAWEELQPIKESDRATYQRRIKEIPKELEIYDKRNKRPEDLVTVTLGHGDIIIMNGYQIQKYLEHKVVPEGYLRFALTCRTVLEHHLKEHERPSYSVGPDTIGYDGSRLQ
ncbi:hypothetical protein LTR56_020899 [Elasticomyces elasticus]|nr:hypothetical protein LTR56_020899 [Elasticomyces elasticus]KAK3654298.1 hypothetical protein LTR22_010774 [Elasticomyces elasticus]KAK4920231.1 hypothetical protein LTR49_012182 [Elasticomyces elasticus]KAK5749830.1 hypothetical protein LTS12_020120 [Elasticomyces elasticus]